MSSVRKQGFTLPAPPSSAATAIPRRMARSARWRTASAPRSRACAGDADADPEEGQNMRAVVDVNCRTASRQGHHSGDHRRDRHRGCTGYVLNMPRGDPRVVDGRPHEPSAHVDRGRCARRACRARREGVRFLRGRPKSPKGAAWDAAMRYWKRCAPTRRAFRPRIRLDAAKLPPIVTWAPRRRRRVDQAPCRSRQIADEAKRLSKHRALNYMA